MSSEFRGQDAIFSDYTKIFITYEDWETGQTVKTQLQEARKFNAKSSIEGVDVKALGKKKATKNKRGNIAGELVMYTGNPIFDMIHERFWKDGITVYFTITEIVEDPESRANRRIIDYYRCSLVEYELSNSDRDGELMETTIPLNYEDYETIQHFTKQI
jgi:hypothetical protein